MPKGKVTKKKDVKSIKDKEGVETEEQGLKLVWITFINEYIKLGCQNAGLAYKIAFKDPEMSDNVANAAGCRLLKNVNVRNELNNALEAQKITDNFIFEGLKDIATTYRGAKTIFAAVKALEILGKMKGLLIDTKKFQFDENNPAVVPPVVPAERAKQLEIIIKGGGVIE